MSSIQDMNNRMKQNRNLRPSKRQKFKGNNRETLYTEFNPEDRPKFKEFSEFQIKKTIDKIRKEAESERRMVLILIIILLLGIISLFITYTIFTKENSVKTNTTNKTAIDDDTPQPIIWNGKLSDPLKLPFSDLYYAPKIKGLDLKTQIEKTIEINSTTMVADSTTNILFFDSDCNLKSELLPADGHIGWMYAGPIKENMGPKRNLYALSKDDTNNDGLINDKDTEYLFISEPNGKGLTKVTERRINSMQWIGSGNELFIEFPNPNDFFNPKKQKDSLYGIYNTETKSLRLTNQKINKENSVQQQQ
ncbi:MAG: hypothetical protein ACTHOM_06965 [Allomuricauda sp.]